MKNIMVDLETFGSNSHSVIISIGAVEFDDTGLGNTFYTLVDPQSCVDFGLKMDVDTVLWWMKQSDAARDAFNRPAQTLDKALQDFSDWVKMVAGNRAEVWGNGATFDNVILANAYSAVGLPKPWAYWADRCYRTLKNLYPQITQDKLGVAHNALDDALYQAAHASKIMAHIMSHP
jgi:exodeoxyribonuclease VIII